MEAPPLTTASSFLVTGQPVGADTRGQLPLPLHMTSEGFERPAMSYDALYQYYLQRYGGHEDRTLLMDLVMMQMPRIGDNLNRWLLGRTNGQRGFTPDTGLPDYLFNWLTNQSRDGTFHLRRVPGTVYNAQVLGDRFSVDMQEKFDAALNAEYRHQYYVVNARDRQHVSLFPKADRGWQDEYAYARRLSHVNPNLQERRENYLRRIGARGLPYPLTTF
jgi:hypothetical protein